MYANSTSMNHSSHSSVASLNSSSHSTHSNSSAYTAYSTNSVSSKYRSLFRPSRKGHWGCLFSSEDEEELLNDPANYEDSRSELHLSGLNLVRARLWRVVINSVLDICSDESA